MALTTLNTIEQNVLTAYNNEALANLGQRLGSRGDTIKIVNFKLRDIFVDTSADIITAVVTNNGINNDISYKDNNGNIINLLTSTNASINSITPVENVGFDTSDYVTFSDIVITKSNSTYNFISKVMVGDEFNSILVLKFDGIDESNRNIAIITPAEEGYVNVYSLYSDTLNHSVENTSFTFDEVYSTIKACGTLDSVLEEFGNPTNADYDDTIGLQFEYYFSVLPKYVVDVYNTNEYDFGSYIGRKQEIVKTLLYSIREYVNGESVYNVSLPIDLTLQFYANSNTDEYYESLPITVNYDSNDDTAITSDSNFILAPADVTKTCLFKVTQMISDLYHLSFITNHLFTLPYIGVDSTGESIWYVDDKPTSINPKGQNIKNQNIVFYAVEQDAGQASTNWFNKTIRELKSFSTTSIDTGNNIESLDEVTFLYTLPSKTTPVGESTTTSYTFTTVLPNIDTLQAKYGDEFDTIIKNSLFVECIDARLSYYGDISGKTNEEIAQSSLAFTLTKSTSILTYITVLFTIEQQGNTYYWKVLTKSDNNNIALDFGSMLGVQSFADFYIQDSITPDDYEHKYLIFDSVPVRLKQSTDTDFSTVKEIYPAIRIDNHSYYTANEVEEQNQDTPSNMMIGYGDLNIVPKFIPANNINRTTNNTVKLNISSIDDKNNVDQHFKIYADDGKYYLNNREEQAFFNTNGVDILPKQTYISEVIDGKEVNITNTYPLFDFREVLTTNQTVLNRLSMFTIGKDGKVYNAFIGNTDSGDPNSVLHIGTSNNNLSMFKNTTLTNDTDKFNTYDRLSIDLPISTDFLTFTKDKAEDNLYYVNISVPHNHSSISTVTPTKQITSIYIKEITDDSSKKYDKYNYTFNPTTYFSSCSSFINTNNKTNVLICADYYTDQKDDVLTFTCTFELENSKFKLKEVEHILNQDSIPVGTTSISSTTSTRELNLRSFDTHAEYLINTIGLTNVIFDKDGDNKLNGTITSHINKLQNNLSGSGTIDTLTPSPEEDSDTDMTVNVALFDTDINPTLTSALTRYESTIDVLFDNDDTTPLA
mgnify:CR=1 FL=1